MSTRNMSLPEMTTAVQASPCTRNETMPGIEQDVSGDGADFAAKTGKSSEIEAHASEEEVNHGMEAPAVTSDESVEKGPPSWNGRHLG